MDSFHTFQLHQPLVRPFSAHCRQPFAPQTNAGFLAVPRIGGDAVAAQEMLLHLLGRRLGQVRDDADVARHHEMGHARDQESDQELSGGFSDERFNDEDRFTNKSGDARIGTHDRKYEPGE